MNIEEARIISTQQAWDGAFITWFHAPALTRGVEAGQFVMVHCAPPGGDPMFARAFSYYRVDGDRFALLYAAIGKGTGWLSQQPAGAPVRIYGPLGNGFTFPDSSANLLLVGGGVGIAPLVDTAERALRAGHHVVAPQTLHARGRDGIDVPSRVTWVWSFRDGEIFRAAMYQSREDAMEAVGLEG